MISLLFAAAAGCSSAPPPASAYDHSVDFKDLKVFDWYADPAEVKAVGGAIVDARFVEEHVKAAVDKDLSKRGYRLSSDGSSDFSIEYHTRANGVLERDQYGLYAWGPVGAQYFRQGTLVLDIRNAEKTLIWRGWYTLTLGTSPEGIARNIRKAVSKILGRFPPKLASS